MKVHYISILLVFFFTGCIKEKTTNYTADVINHTQHSIMILPFKGGIVYPADTIRLMANEQIQIAKGFDRGLISVPGFTSKYFGGPNDSTIVVFDNLYKITHYADTPSKLAAKYYLFPSLRNINNPYSYRFESHDISKYLKENNHFYDFTEQDYLDAK